VLWSRAHDQCAHASCQQALTEEAIDAKTGEIRTNPVGQQAHIRSSKPDGLRYDPEYPTHKLDTYENLILLCPTHHAMVDANGGADFTVDDLIEMREAHEKQAKRRETIDKTIQKVRGGRKQAEARLPVIPSPRVCRWHGALRPRSCQRRLKTDPGASAEN
jgi:hypothetical protein